MPELRRIVRGARVALVVAAIVGYAVISHLVSVTPPPAGVGTVLFAAAPLFVVLFALAARTRRSLAVIVAVAGIALFWRLWHDPRIIAEHLPFVYLMQSVSTNAALMLLFAGSLRRGAEPLCTRLAALHHGRPLAPSIVRYTRQVTIAWAVFFATMIAVSIVLFVTAPVDVWSVVVNLLYMPLVALMFIGEYFVRKRVIRDVPHTPFLSSVRTWWDPAPSERLTAPPR